MEDSVQVNVGAGHIEGAKTGKKLGIGSAVRARIVSLSPDTSDPRGSRIGLTCKQPGLGSLEWLEDDGELIKWLTKNLHAQNVI